MFPLTNFNRIDFTEKAPIQQPLTGYRGIPTFCQAAEDLNHSLCCLIVELKYTCVFRCSIYLQVAGREIPNFLCNYENPDYAL